MAELFGKKTGTSCGMDTIKIYEHASNAIEKARKGKGPTFLDLRTSRYRGHYMSDS